MNEAEKKPEPKKDPLLAAEVRADEAQAKLRVAERDNEYLRTRASGAEDQVRELQKELREARSLRNYWWFVVTAAALIASWPAVESLSSSGKLAYCYIEQGQSTVPYGQVEGGKSHHDYKTAAGFFLHGHREWRSDRTIGWFQTYPEALEAARAVACPVQ